VQSLHPEVEVLPHALPTSFNQLLQAKLSLPSSTAVLRSHRIPANLVTPRFATGLGETELDFSTLVRLRLALHCRNDGQDVARTRHAGKAAVVDGDDVVSRPAPAVPARRSLGNGALDDKPPGCELALVPLDAQLLPWGGVKYELLAERFPL
jgi:hypothetical protein